MIALIKYNAGNTRSVMNALNRLGAEYILSDEPRVIHEADKVIFPGVGEASGAMAYLRERGLDETITALKQPFLGICLGMQLMCAFSEENDTPCLGIFPEKVRRFPPDGNVPHMGWNNLQQPRGELFRGIGETENMYFVHSYYVESGPHTAALCEYLLPFSAALQKDNFYGVQFHPEKSAGGGQKLLRNFLEL
ncbi:MAG TPA: imidazole glycerol phosphate synthase subunit HisH [Caldithrix abyssi]|uniref:Imidazole glycerol phosphate synthase subunit HisH n=1 Tax=Caldithrix abyssi TaxID=187145 RepID=A0A7V5RQF5_CALAY|nr:imidazole glycerol phosphate synthase subunit HisH [Caldithrix abyssi]